MEGKKEARLEKGKGEMEIESKMCKEKLKQKEVDKERRKEDS